MERSAAIRAERARRLQLVEGDRGGRRRNLDAEDLVGPSGGFSSTCDRANCQVERACGALTNRMLRGNPSWKSPYSARQPESVRRDSPSPPAATIRPFRDGRRRRTDYRSRRRQSAPSAFPSCHPCRRTAGEDRKQLWASSGIPVTACSTASNRPRSRTRLSRDSRSVASGCTANTVGQDEDGLAGRGDGFEPHRAKARETGEEPSADAATGDRSGHRHFEGDGRHGPAGRRGLRR